jgi:hypothetical protein
MQPQFITIHYCGCGCGELLPKQQFPSQRRRFIAGHNSRLAARPLAARFAEKVIPAADLSPNGMAGCLLWRSAANRKGYGNIWHIDGKIPATHAAWLIAGHDRPAAGRDLDHLCQRPSCVNVEHLEDVTHGQNVQRGPHVTLNAGLVREIRRRRANGELTVALAREFGVTPPTITNLCRRKTWRNVD